MIRTFVMLAVLVVVGPALGTAAEETIIPIPNGGFEEGLEGWSIPDGEGMASLSTEQAATGQHSLKVVDRDPVNGSNATATRVRIEERGVYELRGKVYPVSGSGLGIYVRLRAANGDDAAPADPFQRGLGGSRKQWEPFALTVYVMEAPAYLELWIHSYSHAKVEAYLDDLHFVAFGTESLKPPWEGQYKLRAEDVDRLTPADVVGPDGLVYPNWTKCGVQGGIPDVPVVTRIEDHGGRAGDDADDAGALDAACRAAGEAGGGAVLLGEGTYYLDRPVTVRHNGVVIRGAGADKTRVIFRYAVPESGAAFYSPAPGARVGPGTRIELHCRPKGLEKMSVMLDETLIKTWERGAHSGNTFSMALWARDAIAKVPDGDYTLRGVGEYADGSRAVCELPVVIDSTFRDTAPLPSSRAAITFEGAGWAGPRVPLTRDGKRGDMVLEVEDGSAFAAGDRVLIDGPATARWKALTKNECRGGLYRRYEVIVESVDANTLAVNQPLRIDFPIIDGSYVQVMDPIEGCGIEDLYIEQTEDLWITTVLFSQAWNCWARGVTVRMCGRNPVYGYMAKWCEIRDCVFDDAWFKGGGGTAYAGWEVAWDCLMEGVETFKLRHAPLFQWAASGCVIRKSVFHESDAQWHSGWTNENLMEQCVVESVTGNGGYGYGMWASPPEDTAHGPNGPRNVVYNCDVSSERDGLWMGGMNEGWMILYNRFVVGKGPGVFAKTASFDHTIRGNVFVLKDGTSPMVMLATPDCSGTELTGNVLYGGNGELADGLAEAELGEGNAAMPLQDAARPMPAVPSIYEWQQANVRGGD